MIQFNKGEGSGFVGLILWGIILSPIFKYVPAWLMEQTFRTGGGIFYKMGFRQETLQSMREFFGTFHAATWMDAIGLGMVATLVLTLVFVVWIRIRSFRESIRS